jgi:hypothetical protein
MGAHRRLQTDATYHVGEPLLAPCELSLKSVIEAAVWAPDGQEVLRDPVLLDVSSLVDHDPTSGIRIATRQPSAKLRW